MRLLSLSPLSPFPFEVCHTDTDSLGNRRLVRVFQASRGKREASEGREKREQIGICRPKERLCGSLATQVTDIKGAFHLGKKPGNFGGSKSGISDWQNVVPFGRKHRYVAVLNRGPGTGTNYEKGKWNTTFRSEIPTGKTGPPF